ncbi:ABC-type sugar transport system substrate-binding protein [Bifidobacterium commune]|uniref:sugar ABC transporter substrate-binding protein n=1 Tax=Bifidobacterium commune TaxID=1505727 RepID=UPI000B809803|nr:sugar ABC transporter substrate-binding protein [Bifidobacterium commune]MBB2955333.1 ABC-type sugar transport system substrate-binding protein [Bifidobacterium commune]
MRAKLQAGTAAKPTAIAVLGQDSTSGSIVNRVNSFVKSVVEEINKLPDLDGAVSVSDQEKWTKNFSKPAKAKVVVTVHPTTSQADIQSAATSILGTQGLMSIFSSNQDGVSATNDGTALNKQTDKYRDIFVIGFDSGSSQRKALKGGEFLGSANRIPIGWAIRPTHWPSKPPRKVRFPIPIPGHTGTTTQTIPTLQSCSTTDSRLAQETSYTYHLGVAA